MTVRNVWGFASRSFRQAMFLGISCIGIYGAAGAIAAGFIPPQNLDPSSGRITLNSNYQQDAWLVYTYNIGADGQVVDAKIQSSNGVDEVEQAVLMRVNAMRFRPASRNGMPIKVAADPVVFTWILDKPREMSPEFQAIYQEAWALLKQEDYDGAFDLTVQLETFKGRNAYEEVKFQILAASLANRWDDEAAELQHLNRVVELQDLAVRNRFQNSFVEEQQFLMILSRIQTLQLNRMMMADASTTLNTIQALGPGSSIAQEAQARLDQAKSKFESMPDATVSAELMPIYRKGPGAWKTGLSRRSFSISHVQGDVEGVFLVCSSGEMQLQFPSIVPWNTPPHWSQCKIDVTGKAGTRFTLHQHASG